MLNGVEVKCPAVNLLGKIRDVLRLAERHAERLKLRHTGGDDGLRIHVAQGVMHTLPDGRLRFHGYLLADDVVHDGGEEVCVNRALDMSDAVNDPAHTLVLLPQVGKLRLAVFKIHGLIPPRGYRQITL